MAERVRPEFLDLGGGLNEGDSPHAIGDNQFTLLENFFPFATKIIRRNGTLRISPAPWLYPHTGFLSYRDPEAGVGATAVAYVLGDRRGFSWYSAATGFSDIPALSGTATTPIPQIPSSDLPWHLFQNGPVIYAIRGDGETGLMRLEFNGYSVAGIDPPPTAATIADGGVGVLSAADYQLVYTFYNTATGAESNASPVSNTLALAADRQIAATGIATSSDPQVNARRVYRNVPGTLGAWLRVGEILDNITTTFTDNVATALMGPLIGEENAPPPPVVVSGDVHAERLFVTDGVDVFYSEPFKYESFSEFSVMEDFRQYGRLNTIYSHGNRVYVGGAASMHYIEGTSTFTRRELSRVHGCAAPHTMRGAEGLLFWYGGDDFYRSDGLNVEGIGGVKIKKLLARIPVDLRARMTAAVYPKYSWYVVTCPVSAYLSDPGDTIDEGLPPVLTSPNNNLIIGYNYRTQAWFTFTFIAGESPCILTEALDFDSKLRLFATFYDGHIYQLDYGRVDETILGPRPITAKFRTKAHRLGRAGMLSGVRRVLFKTTDIVQFAPISLYRDEDTTAIKSVNPVSSGTIDEFFNEREWKSTNISTMGELGALWQIHCEYTGAAPIQVEGYALEGVALNRNPRSR